MSLNIRETITKLCLVRYAHNDQITSSITILSVPRNFRRLALRQNYIWIFTMVSFFLRWTLLKFFDSFPDNKSHEVVPAVGQITRAVICTWNDVKYLLLWKFWIYNVYRRILGRVLVGNIVNIRNECLIFLGSWGMNRIAEQTNRTRTASRFTRFVCPALRFIPHEPRKKDTHSLSNNPGYIV